MPELIDPRFRENKPKALVFSNRKRAFWACFRENRVYNFGHRFTFFHKNQNTLDLVSEFKPCLAFILTPDVLFPKTKNEASWIFFVRLILVNHPEYLYNTLFFTNHLGFFHLLLVLYPSVPILKRIILHSQNITCQFSHSFFQSQNELNVFLPAEI